MQKAHRTRDGKKYLLWFLAGLMFIIGLAICLLGARLAFVGGTFYFVAMGLAMIIAAVLIARRRRSGIILYAIAFVASLFWAVADAGWHYWPLFSRLFTLGVLAFLCAIAWPLMPGHSAKKARLSA